MPKILVDSVAELKAKTGVDVVNDDLSKYSNEELLSALKSATLLEQYYAQVSVTEKTFMNSIYGATGTKHYEFASFECAEDICLEGQFYIKKGQEIANKYLREQWHLDIETHKKIKEKFGEDKFTGDFTEQLPYIDYVVYIDTDSIYVEFDQLVNSVGFNGRIPELIVYLNDIVFRDLFSSSLGGIVDKRHGENYLKFDLENTNAVGFFLAKKKYLLAHSWADSSNEIYDKPHEHLKGKGIEIARREFSNLVIKMIKFILASIIEETLNRDNYKAYMRSAFDVFCKVDIQECCKFVNLNKSNDYIAYSNAEGFALNKRALPQHKGVARFNHLRIKHKLEEYYPPIKDGVKVGSYLDIKGEWFSFELGEFPKEIAPEIDRLAMFQKVVITPINRFAALAGYDVDDLFSKTTQINV